MAVKGIDRKVIGQICLGVKDVEKSAENYRRVFGWDIPADRFDTTRLSDHTHAKYYGETTDAQAKLVGFMIGDIQFELLQPLGPSSEWQDYVDRHGEGIHHIAFFIDDTDVVAQSFVDHGYQITQEGLFTGQTGKYTYLDTNKDLGIVIELLEFFRGLPPMKAPEFPSDKGIGTDVITQVGIIVKDIEATSKRISEVLGLPEPEIIQTPGYDVAETTYKGEPSEATAKLAFFDLGQVQIELIEPDEKPSVWRDYLDEKGEGAQHLAVNIKDTKAVTEYLASLGIPVVQQGLFADGSGMYTYVDSVELLGTTLELLENFSS